MNAEIQELVGAHNYALREKEKARAQAAARAEDAEALVHQLQQDLLAATSANAMLNHSVSAKDMEIFRYKETILSLQSKIIADNSQGQLLERRERELLESRNKVVEVELDLQRITRHAAKLEEAVRGLVRDRANKPSSPH